MRMRVLGVAIAIVIAGSVAPAAATSPLRPPRLTHAGRFFTDAQGRVVILHGVNMVNKLGTYAPSDVGFGADDIKYLVSQGFNTLRLGFTWKGFEPRPGHYDTAYLRKILDTARLAGNAGLWVTLDFHQDMWNEKYQGQGAPDWAALDDGLAASPKEGFPNNYVTMPALHRAYTNFFADAKATDGRGLVDAWAAMFGRVAANAKSLPRLLGYELMNEPFPGDAFVTCTDLARGCPDEDARLAADYSRVIKAIRARDARSVVIYEPWVLFNYLVPTNLPKLEDRNAAFGFHVYCALTLVPAADKDTPEKQAQACGRSVTNANAHQRSSGDALLVSEFGFATPAGMREFDDNLLSWQYWAWRGTDNSNPDGTARSYGIIRDPSQPPTPDNLEQSILDVIVEPYPQAVAGTPTKSAFDPTTKTYRLEYTPTRADGKGQFRKGSVTEVFVPERHYPNGYAVQVSGAKVTSRPNARILTLAARSSTGTITCTLSPR
jgi:endoglycosylceramidase